MQIDAVTSLLTLDDLQQMLALENACWPHQLRADQHRLQHRFSMQHAMQGIWHAGRLIGMAAWRKGWLELPSGEFFPQDFDAFSMQNNAEPYNAAFVYNLCIHPDARGKLETRCLIQSVIAQARQSGCAYLVGDGRCPSFNGSEVEGIPARPQFRDALQRHMQSYGVAFPPPEVCCLDPLLNFYHSVLKCEFFRVMPDFMASDSSSGGYRIIFYAVL